MKTLLNIVALLALTAVPAFAQGVPNGRYCGTTNLSNGTRYVQLLGKITVEPFSPTGCTPGTEGCSSVMNPEAAKQTAANGCAWSMTSFPFYAFGEGTQETSYYPGEPIPAAFSTNGSPNCPFTDGNGWINFDDGYDTTPPAGSPAPTVDGTVYNAAGNPVGYFTLNGAKACR